MAKIISLLDHRDKEYRGATIMRNFQLIHYYDAGNDTVYIDAVWDMRMNPTRLKKIIK